MFDMRTCFRNPRRIRSPGGERVQGCQPCGLAAAHRGAHSSTGNDVCASLRLGQHRRKGAMKTRRAVMIRRSSPQHGGRRGVECGDPLAGNLNGPRLLPKVIAPTEFPTDWSGGFSNRGR